MTKCNTIIDPNTRQGTKAIDSILNVARLILKDFTDEEITEASAKMNACLLDYCERVEYITPGLASHLVEMIHKFFQMAKNSNVSKGNDKPFMFASVMRKTLMELIEIPEPKGEGE